MRNPAIDSIVLVVSNDEWLYSRMCEYAADNPDDLPQAAADYCDDVLAALLTDGWKPAVEPDRPLARAIRALIGELLPTGADPDTVEAIEELMREAIAE